ncbi:MAG: hypothetical protein CTY31_01295 [Hyphomicrobium sp.]|nr:MAG: hypothetical protein CTY39_00190 [Hyphomicrobium sp.]PPD01438.1 MAG: hypothetical protein CTY31_01295 [Hyphomicrobium sp.]
MLRRYVIVNGVTTLLMYAAVWAYAPHLSSLTQSLREDFDIYAMDNPMLGPIVHRIISVSGG